MRWNVNQPAAQNKSTSEPKRGRNIVDDLNAMTELEYITLRMCLIRKTGFLAFETTPP